jgi:hypothetical protein
MHRQTDRQEQRQIQRQTDRHIVDRERETDRQFNFQEFVVNGEKRNLDCLFLDVSGKCYKINFFERLIHDGVIS